MLSDSKDVEINFSFDGAKKGFILCGFRVIHPTINSISKKNYWVVAAWEGTSPILHAIKRKIKKIKKNVFFLKAEKIEANLS